MTTLADVLHRLVDLVLWREESQQLAAHDVIRDSLEAGPDTGSHASDAGVVAAGVEDDIQLLPPKGKA